MIKIEKIHKAESFFNKSQDASWDRFREKIFRVSFCGMTLFKKTENLNIDYHNIDGNKMGYK